MGALYTHSCLLFLSNGGVFAIAWLLPFVGTPACTYGLLMSTNASLALDRSTSYSSSADKARRA